MEVKQWNAIHLNMRAVVFITRANPEQNSFTLWLGTKLAAAGYLVWADVLRLRMGQDWQRKIEDAIRNRAYKVLLVANGPFQRDRELHSDTEQCAQSQRCDGFSKLLRFFDGQTPHAAVSYRNLDPQIFRSD